MIGFYTWCADSDVPELRRLTSTISRRSEQIFAYHRSGGASNGRIENTHMLAEKIRRISHGFTNHDNFRGVFPSPGRTAGAEHGYSTAPGQDRMGPRDPGEALSTCRAT